MINSRTLPGYIWFDGHIEFKNYFKEKLYWDPDNGYREFLMNKGRKKKELMRREMKLKMEKKLDRIRQTYGPEDETSV